MPHSNVSVFPMMLSPHLTALAAFHQRVSFQSIFNDADVTASIAFVEEALLVADSPVSASELAAFGAPFASFQFSGFMNPRGPADLGVFWETEIEPLEYEQGETLC